ncbi:MAG: LptF/LptG family permease [Treponema sp.]|nr:LptF/LptG family permease [Treponema sp.]
MNPSRRAESRRGVSGIIFRYLAGEAFFSFLVSFLFFFFIFFVNQLLLMAQDILTQKVPLNQVALLVLYALPSIIALSAPFAALVGILMTVGRLTSDNEILVMLSSGLSYRNIFIPAMLVGVVISMLSFFTNDVLLPAGTVQYRRLYRQILASTPALELEPNSVKRFKDTVIVTGPVSGRAFDNLLIMDRTSEGERRIIMAHDAEFVDSGSEGISLDLHDAFIQSSGEIVREDYDYASAGYLQYWIPQDDLIQAVSAISPAEMSSVDVKKEIDTRNAELLQRLDDRRIRAMPYAMSIENILRNGPQGADWNKRDNTFNTFSREYQAVQSIKKDMSLRNYQLEYYKKFSIPFGAFFFVFLAVPLGLLAKKSGQTVGFIFGLLIAVIYWALLLGGQTMGARLGYSPFWSMWMPNILTGAIGLIMCGVRLRK